MKQDNFEDLLEGVAPEHFRQFRLLYNELLGYIQRGEMDKVAEFQNRIDQQMATALDLQIAFQKRIDALANQKDESRKQLLHQKYRNPKQSIVVTDPFPLPKGTDPIVEDVIKDIQPEPAEVFDMPSLETDRQVDALLSEMKAFNEQRLVDKQISKDPIEEKEVSVSLNEKVKAEIATILSPDVPEEMIEDIVDDAHVLDDQFVDDELAVRTKNVAQNEDVVPDSVDSDPKKITTDASEASLEDRYKKRKQRVKDYIEKDQSKGGISSDLL